MRYLLRILAATIASPIVIATYITCFIAYIIVALVDFALEDKWRKFGDYFPYL